MLYTASHAPAPTSPDSSCSTEGRTMRHVIIVGGTIAGGAAICFCYDLYGVWWAGLAYVGVASIAMGWAILNTKREDDAT